MNPASAEARAVRPVPQHDGDRAEWLISIPLDDSIHGMTCPAGWVENGPLLGFFHGLLFDRDLLRVSGEDGAPEVPNAALILGIFALEGENGLKRLRGSFALAVIDRRSRKAFVMRDATGAHPLFCAETPSSLLFSETPQHLLKQRGVSRQLNRIAMADHLCQRWPDPRETYFSAVQRVPPGWWAVLAGGRLHLERWWIPAPDGNVRWLERQDVARFDEVLERAVARCLDHGKTGIFLSGGLDSVSVAAIAKDLSARRGLEPLLALSLGFSDPACDERTVQAGIARQLQLPFQLVDLDEALEFRPLLQESLRANDWLPSPLLNMWLPGYLSLAQAAKNAGVKIVLTGQGGDEWLNVTPLLAADLVMRGEWLRLLELFRTQRRSHTAPWTAHVRNVFWTRSLRPIAGLLWQRAAPGWHDKSRVSRSLAGDPPWISPDPKLRAQQSERTAKALPNANPAHGFYLRELAATLDHPVTSWGLEEQYAFGRRFGIQLLHPYFDADLVELLYRTPPRLLYEGARSKSLVRGVLARRFPALGFERQKKVTSVAYCQSLLMSQGTALLDACGDFPALSELGIIDNRVAKSYFRDLLKRGGSRVHELSILVNLEMWTRSQVN